MKPAVILAIIIILIGGFLIVQDLPSLPTTNTTHTTSAARYLLNEQDLRQLGMSGNCTTEEYQTSASSPLVQYSFCSYNISSMAGTELVIELKKFTNFEDLNGTYQYNSLHMFSAQGLISQNTLGDQSRFRVNNENDYGGNLTPPGVYYYHLWITKNLHLIHVTSGGNNKDAGEHVTRAGQMMLSKLEFKLA